MSSNSVLGLGLMDSVLAGALQCERAAMMSRFHVRTATVASL